MGLIFFFFLEDILKVLKHFPPSEVSRWWFIHSQFLIWPWHEFVMWSLDGGGGGGGDITAVSFHTTPAVKWLLSAAISILTYGPTSGKHSTNCAMACVCFVDVSILQLSQCHPPGHTHFWLTPRLWRAISAVIVKQVASLVFFWRYEIISNWKTSGFWGWKGFTTCFCTSASLSAMVEGCQRSSDPAGENNEKRRNVKQRRRSGSRR